MQGLDTLHFETTAIQPELSSGALMMLVCSQLTDQVSPEQIAEFVGLPLGALKEYAEVLKDDSTCETILSEMWNHMY